MVPLHCSPGLVLTAIKHYAKKETTHTGDPTILHQDIRSGPHQTQIAGIFLFFSVPWASKDPKAPQRLLNSKQELQYLWNRTNWRETSAQPFPDLQGFKMPAVKTSSKLACQIKFSGDL